METRATAGNRTEVDPTVENLAVARPVVAQRPQVAADLAASVPGVLAADAAVKAVDKAVDKATTGQEDKGQEDKATTTGQEVFQEVLDLDLEIR